MEPPPLGAGHVPVLDSGRTVLRRHRRHRLAHPGDLLSSDFELAVDLAVAAGSLLVERFGHARDVRVKSSATDMVSSADKDAETLIRGRLEAERPDDGLMGEEGSRRDSASGRRWVVDPLDGTTNFLYGFPGWAVSIALDGELGVVFDPVRDELFSAVYGRGAKLNDEPLDIGAHADLATALIATGFGYDPERRGKQGQVIARMLPRIRDIRRAGAASLDLCWLAAGRLDGYYERGLSPWDWAAGRLVVSEAGGEVKDLDEDPHGLIAANPELLPELAALLGEAEAGVFI